MNKASKFYGLFEYFAIAGGTFLLALAISLFFSPNDLVTGGVTGLAIVISGVSEKLFGFEVPIWLTNIVFNIPLLLIGWRVRGLGFIKRTLFATIVLTVSLYATDLLPQVLPSLTKNTDMFLSAVFGGVIGGAGLGIVFRFNATTGGSDLAAGIIHKYWPHISLSRFMFVIDACIILAGFFTFGSERTLYAIVSVFVSLKAIDAVLEGFSFSKAAFIISDHSKEIADKIINDLDRSATILDGRGAYSMNEKNVILCVVSKKEIVQLKQIAVSADNNAFVIVADVREVLGEGFFEYESL